MLKKKNSTESNNSTYHIHTQRILTPTAVHEVKCDIHKMCIINMYIYYANYVHIVIGMHLCHYDRYSISKVI